MKTFKALSVAVGLLIAADSYVITQASAMPVPTTPLVTTDNLVMPVRQGGGRYGGGGGRHGGGDIYLRRRHGGSYMGHGGAYMRHGGNYMRPGYRHYGNYGAGYRHYGSGYGRYGYRHYGNYRHHRYGHDNNYYFASPWLGLAPFAYGLGYGYGGYGYDGSYDDYPVYGTGIVEWCSRRYRSYNPATGMYFTGSRWRLCRPY